MMARWGSMFVLLATVIVMGCEEPLPPPNVPQQQSAQPVNKEPPRPTTQQLLEGPTKRMRLEAAPFSIEVPDSWGWESDLPVPVIMGPGIVGDISVRPQLLKLTSGQIAKVVQNALVKKDENDRLLRYVKRWEQGQVVFIERRIAQSATPPTTAAATQPVDRSGPLRWHVRMFVPKGSDFEEYDMNFDGLSEIRAEKNKPLLEKVVKSLRYEP